MEAYQLFEEAKAYYLEHTEVENWRHIIGELYLIESLTLFAKPFEMIKYIKKASKYLNEGKSLIAGPFMLCTRGRLQSMSLYYKEIGSYRIIRDFLEENIKYFKQVSDGCGSGMRYLVCAEYAYDMGEVEEAKVYAYKAIYRAEIKKQLCVVLDAYFILMRINIIEGNLEEIDQHIEQIDQSIVKGTYHPTIRHMVDMIKGYIYGLTNQYQKIPEWSRNLSIQSSIEALPNAEMVPINLGLILLYKKEYIQLEILMESCIEEYNKSKSIYVMILAYILSAIAKLKLYDEDEGAEALQEAIKIAEPDQIIMPFIEYQKYIRELLVLLAPDSAFIRKILAYQVSGQIENQKEDESQDLQNLLTEREKDVMKLFVKGYKQSEVAKELQITTDTAKRHIKNVYAKLNIHSKAELIEKLGNTL